MTTLLKTLPITKFHRDGTKPCHGEVFVFSSNLAGDFSHGMAKEALAYGAASDITHGRHGKTWAIPVRGKDMDSLSYREIAVNVLEFLEHARERFRQDQFFVTPIGGRELLLPSSGRPGYLVEVVDTVWPEECEIAQMFRGAPINCSFPASWREYLA